MEQSLPETAAINLVGRKGCALFVVVALMNMLVQTGAELEVVIGVSRQSFGALVLVEAAVSDILNQQDLM